MMCFRGRKIGWNPRSLKKKSKSMGEIKISRPTKIQGDNQLENRKTSRQAKNQENHLTTEGIDFFMHISNLDMIQQINSNKSRSKDKDP